MLYITAANTAHRQRGYNEGEYNFAQSFSISEVGNIFRAVNFSYTWQFAEDAWQPGESRPLTVAALTVNDVKGDDGKVRQILGISRRQGLGEVPDDGETHNILMGAATLADGSADIRTFTSKAGKKLAIQRVVLFDANGDEIRKNKFGIPVSLTASVLLGEADAYPVGALFHLDVANFRSGERGTVEFIAPYGRENQQKRVGSVRVAPAKPKE